MLISTLVLVPPCDAPATERSSTDRLVHQRVRQILGHYRSPRSTGDRRSDYREPFPYPIHVTPLGPDGSPRVDETLVVLGKHLSERGLDFYYEAPLPYRRVIVSWECPGGRWLALLLDLRWCRSTRHGWYENGGRFLQVVRSPLETAGAETRCGQESEPSEDIIG
jgi:hypothetical protein